MHKRWSAAALVTAAVIAAPSAFAGPDVGVSISISQPGVYGRVDIGQFPQPQVYVAQPVIIAAPRVRPEPVYMWVPPGHRKHWNRHCAEYRACGVPVYFVQDRWYHDHIDRRDGPPRHDDRDDRRGRDWDRQDHDHGRGHGRGHGRD